VIRLLSKFRRPGAINSEPSRDTQSSCEFRRTLRDRIISHNSRLATTSAASCGARPYRKTEPVGYRSRSRGDRVSPLAMYRSNCGSGSDLIRPWMSADTYMVGLCPKGGSLWR